MVVNPDKFQSIIINRLGILKEYYKFLFDSSELLRAGRPTKQASRLRKVAIKALKTLLNGTLMLIRKSPIYSK